MTWEHGFKNVIGVGNQGVGLENHLGRKTPEKLNVLWDCLAEIFLFNFDESTGPVLSRIQSFVRA